MKSVKSAVVGALVAVVVFGGIQVVSGAVSSKVITMCANKTTGAVRYTTKSCSKKLETTLMLNSQGVSGSAGIAGSKGDAGTAGVAGAKGDTGASGTAGATGTAGAKGETGTNGTSGTNATNGTNGTNGAPGNTCQRAWDAICEVGDIGPGGGIVFYVGTFTAAGTTCNTTCRYLEVAESLWDTGLPEPQKTWSTGSNQSAQVSGADGIVIGTGFQNSLDIAAQSNNVSASSAAVLAREYRGGSRTDWFLPSKDELNALCVAFSDTVESAGAVCNGSAATGHAGVGGFIDGYYWSSSETEPSRVWYQSLGYGFQGSNVKDNPIYVRPVRAF